MKLYEAAQDRGLMTELKDYFEKVLKEVAIEKVYNGDNTLPVKEAREIINAAFQNIENQFSPKVEPKKPINEAR
jgi:hypothetical protein